MKLGEFDPDNNGAVADPPASSRPAGTWVNSNANNAVTETADRLRARA